MWSLRDDCLLLVSNNLWGYTFDPRSWNKNKGVWSVCIVKAGSVAGWQANPWLLNKHTIYWNIIMWERHTCYHHKERHLGDTLEKHQPFVYVPSQLMTGCSLYIGGWICGHCCHFSLMFENYPFLRGLFGKCMLVLKIMPKVSNDLFSLHHTNKLCMLILLRWVDLHIQVEKCGSNLFVFKRNFAMQWMLCCFIFQSHRFPPLQKEHAEYWTIKLCSYLLVVVMLGVC